MRKLTVSDLRYVLTKYHKEEITFSKMVEILNERSGFLEHIKENPTWERTNYGLSPFVKCPLENGCWYEIGFLNNFDKQFFHQGIKQFNDGFFDENNYHLKPFPTHFKKIELSNPNLPDES